MSWERIGSGDTGLVAWTWDADEERHFLVLHDGELREYHEVPAPAAPTVHVYVPDDLYEGRSESHGDPAAIRYPLLETTHVRTYEVAGNHAPWVRALDDRELIEWLMTASYASAT